MAKNTQELQEGQKIKLVDPASGAETFAVYGGKKKFSLAEEWTTSTKKGRSEMSNLKAENLPLFNANARVALWCEAHLTYGNFLDITWKEAAEDLSLSKSQISRAVKQLQEAGYLLADKSKRWRIHPKFAHFGSQRTLGKEREKANVIYAEFSNKKKSNAAVHAAILQYEHNGGDIEEVLKHVDDEFFSDVEAALYRVAKERGFVEDTAHDKRSNYDQRAFRDLLDDDAT